MKEHINDSPLMESAFADRESDRRMRLSVCVSLYTVLALIWMPGFSLGAYDIPLTPEVKPTQRVVLKPPPEKPVEVVERRETHAKKTPIPDQTPDEPEILVEPEPMEEPDLLFTDDWVIGIPDAPAPSEPSIIYGDMVGVEKPVITKRVQPEYPERAVKIRIQGYVLLQAVMRKDGTIGDIKVIRGLAKGKFGFEEAAIRSVRQWEFLPGKYQGKPADVILNLRVSFVLN